MDRQDDKSADGCDTAATPVTGRTLPPVDRLGVQGADEAKRDAGMHGHIDHSLPLPLRPSSYALSSCSPEPPFLRASVAATLPPKASLELPRLDVTLFEAQATYAQAAEPVASVNLEPDPEPQPVPEPEPEPAPQSVSQGEPEPVEIVEAVSAPIIAEVPSHVLAPASPNAFNIGAMAQHRPMAPLAIDPVRRPSAIEMPAPASRIPDTGTLPQYAKLGLKIAGYFAAGWLALIVTLIFVYRFVNPPMSSLMLQQTLTGQEVTQTWVAIEDISPQIVRAVLLSEDGRFCQHSGIDFDAMQDAIERAGDGPPRGASTISMQVTKNLFLWPSKSYIRKAIEVPLTWAIELVWPKRRIMEVYLNIAEWGPGIFGVEAASRFHFQKGASRLNEREAAQLAVALPNPYIRDAGDPGPKTRRLASDIQTRMRNAYTGQTACVLVRATKGE